MLTAFDSSESFPGKMIEREKESDKKQEQTRTIDARKVKTKEFQVDWSYI